MHLSIEHLPLAIDRSGRLFDTAEVVRWHQTTCCNDFFPFFSSSRGILDKEIDRAN